MVAISGQDKILLAAQRLAQGRLVAFPTETVYGLGADAENPLAVAKIYKAKQRPANHPVIVHIAPDVDPQYWVKKIPPQAQILMAKFWPGPLTLILPRADHIPDTVSGGQDSIGLRCPSHPVAQNLLHSFAQLSAHGNGGIAAPSANKFGQISPTSALHVQQEFPDMDEQDLMILDGGASAVGIESTIVDLSRVDQGIGPVLLRPGHINVEQLQAVLNQEILLPDNHAPRVSGSLKAHYAPKTRLVMLAKSKLLDLLQGKSDISGWLDGDINNMAVITIGNINLNVPESVKLIAASPDPVAYAHDIYALLRRLDRDQLDLIVLERPDTQQAAWQGILDRLTRAAAAFSDL